MRASTTAGWWPWFGRFIPDCLVIGLIERYLGHVREVDGEYAVVSRGISAGCPLSPLLGALYLRELDEAMESSGLFYARFMDDWVVLSPQRWKLRKAIRAANQVLSRLGLEQHPDKTFMGYVARGFDFLGYTFGPDSAREGVGVAAKTVANFLARATRLYEHGADKVRIGSYVRRWFAWLRSGLGGGVWVEESRARFVNVALAINGTRNRRRALMLDEIQMDVSRVTE